MATVCFTAFILLPLEIQAQEKGDSITEKCIK